MNQAHERRAARHPQRATDGAPSLQVRSIYADDLVSGVGGASQALLERKKGANAEKGKGKFTEDEVAAMQNVD